jgi:flagellar basal body-associated protein FliL
MVEAEAKDSVGLLVVAIVLMVAVICLFAYLMYKEKDKLDKEPEPKHAQPI